MGVTVSDQQSGEARTHDRSVLVTRVSILTITSIFFASWFIAHGVSVRDAVAAILVVGIQVAGGSALWSLLQRDRSVGLSESLGMGFALGTTTSTVADQLLLSTPAQSFGWLIPLLASIVVWYHGHRHHLGPTPRNTERTEDEIGLITVVVLCVFLGRGLLIDGWLWGTIIMTVGVVITLWTYTLIGGSRRLVVLGACSLLGVTLIFWMKPPIEYGSWLLHPLYTGTDDAVFSEGRGYSLSNFGPTNNASAINSSIRYHWFSLA